MPGVEPAADSAALPEATKASADMQKQLDYLNHGSESAANALLADFVNLFENGKLNEAQWLIVDQIFMGLLQLKT